MNSLSYFIIFKDDKGRALHIHADSCEVHPLGAIKHELNSSIYL